MAELPVVSVFRIGESGWLNRVMIRGTGKLRRASFGQLLARFWPKIRPNHRFDYRHSGAKTAIIPNPLVFEASVRAFAGVLMTGIAWFRSFKRG